MRLGQVDMMLNLTIEPSRKKYINFIGPQTLETVVFVTLQSPSISINHLKEIKNLKKPVSVTLGVYYGEEFKQLMQNDPEFKQNIVVVKETEKSALLLAANRISGFLTSKIIYNYKVNTDPKYSRFKIDDIIIYSTPIYMVFLKNQLIANN